MILRHLSLHRELEWNETRHMCELVVENQKFFREIIKDLTITEEEKEVCVTINGQPLNFDKDVDVIFNPTKLDFNSKRAMATLLKLLVKTSISEDFYLTTNKLKTKIVKYFSSIVDAGAFEFEVSASDFAMDSIAKAISIHIVGDEDDFVELLTDYVSMMAELANIKLFVFVNLRSFISNNELERLKHNLDNHQIDTLLLENREKEPVRDVSRLTVDSDLCEI